MQDLMLTEKLKTTGHLVMQVNVVISSPVELDSRDILLNAVVKLRDVNNDNAPVAYDNENSFSWASGYGAALDDMVQILLYGKVIRR